LGNSKKQARGAHIKIPMDASILRFGNETSWSIWPRHVICGTAHRTDSQVNVIMLVTATSLSEADQTASVRRILCHEAWSATRLKHVSKCAPVCTQAPPSYGAGRPRHQPTLVARQQLRTTSSHWQPVCPRHTLTPYPILISSLAVFDSPLSSPSDKKAVSCVSTVISL
jgi:hypothetical protein